MASPPYTAVIEWLAAVRVEIESVAVPAPSVPVPSVAAPSLKVTVPVAALGVTVAVNLTACRSEERRVGKECRL